LAGNSDQKSKQNTNDQVEMYRGEFKDVLFYKAVEKNAERSYHPGNNLSNLILNWNYQL
jgi:hypothetical protein